MLATANPYTKPPIKLTYKYQHKPNTNPKTPKHKPYKYNNHPHNNTRRPHTPTRPPRLRDRSGGTHKPNTTLGNFLRPPQPPHKFRVGLIGIF